MTAAMPSSRLALRHLSKGLALPRASAGPRIRPAQQTHLYSTSDSMPKIAQPSFWNSLVPKFLRSRPSNKHSSTAPQSKEWNPASYYIIIFILIGSQAIRMLALKHDFAAYTRSTDSKISLLREVIEKVQRGEDVDVRKLLGTGDETKEREWEQVLHELEEGHSIWHKNRSESKSTKQSQREQEKPAPKDSQAKDPAVPAEGNTQAQSLPQNGGDAVRKSNFF